MPQNNAPSKQKDILLPQARAIIQPPKQATQEQADD